MPDACHFDSSGRSPPPPGRSQIRECAVVQLCPEPAVEGKYAISALKALNPEGKKVDFVACAIFLKEMADFL
jgi:hypothetical protein